MKVKYWNWSAKLKFETWNLKVKYWNWSWSTKLKSESWNRNIESEVRSWDSKFWKRNTVRNRNNEVQLHFVRWWPTNQSAKSLTCLSSLQIYICSKSVKISWRCTVGLIVFTKLWRSDFEMFGWAKLVRDTPRWCLISLSSSNAVRCFLLIWCHIWFETWFLIVVTCPPVNLAERSVVTI